MKNNFEMYAQKVNGAIHVNLSGRLDVSWAVEILRFLHLYARGKCPIVMEASNLSPDSSMSFDVLQKGLQRLSNLGHPIRQAGKEALFKICADKGDIYRR